MKYGRRPQTSPTKPPTRIITDDDKPNAHAAVNPRMAGIYGSAFIIFAP
jgi:hypothetical protein